MNKIYYLLLFTYCFSFFSCDIINPEEEIPAYIQFDGFELAVGGGQGSNFEKITEGWIYVDGDLLGAFSEGKPFPALYEGTVDIIVDPGIHANGVSVQTEIYPLYDRYSTTVELVKGEVTNITPKFNYIDESVFIFVEDFSDTHIFSVDRDFYPDTFIEIENTDVIDGPAGIINLDTENPVIEVASSFSFSELPVDNINTTFLEITYKTDVPFNIGLIATDSYGLQKAYFSHGLNIKQEWNKAYLDLTELLVSVRAPTYQVAFRAALTDNLNNASIYLDDIKLVHSTY